MAKVQGIFQSCVDPGLFSMTYICDGTVVDCSLITTLPGLICTVDNRSTTCSDGFTCPSSGVQFTTKTQFDLAGSDFSFSKTVQSETCEWALSQDEGSTDVSASSTGSSCGTDNGAASAASRRIYSPSWRSLVAFLAMLLLVLPASATPTPSVSGTEVIIRSDQQLDGIFEPRTADNNGDLASRALPEEIAVWRRYWKSFTEPTKPQPFDPEKFYKIFRSMTVRETVRAGLSTADWSMIAEDAWGHLSAAIQNAACRQMLSEGDSRTWKNRVVGPVTKDATEVCVKSVKLRAMAIVKDPKKYFTKFKPTRGMAALMIGAFVACDTMVNLAAEALFSTMAPQLKLLPSSMCNGACFDDSYKRLTDAENCGKCGIKGPGACVISECNSAATSDTLSKCGQAPNRDSCACVAADLDNAHCVLYSSSVFNQLTDSCLTTADCDPSQVCAAFPGGSGGKACLDATSCQQSETPSGPTETLPENRVWQLRYEDEDGRPIWSENPVHLATVSRGSYLITASESTKPTVNTKCVPIGASGTSTVGGGGIVGGVPGKTYLPKNGDFYFGYDDETLLSAVDYDTCCLYLYASADCSGPEAAEYSGGCQVMFGPLPVDIWSYQVKNCRMMLPSST
ncbi:hypothetical protein B0T16DRAFT_517872 [Cercophora newfieldiana]|uniref:Uncharacterized protein n=1 Tax=Cercophora newfieldiana TaxID=92897 RepID=A0AA40CJ76_9PEZI|nr:hypothetical protein B0T16DRAFT_517872 [Cercophora newfieldiana]